MSEGVNFFEFSDTDAGVDLSGVESGVSELLLDETDIGAIFEHEGGAGVSEEVAAALFIDIDGLDDS